MDQAMRLKWAAVAFTIFWIGGIILSAAVGPAQASSRSLLARVTPLGMQGEIFGLYATTGRVMSFLSPLLWALWHVPGPLRRGRLGVQQLIAAPVVFAIKFVSLFFARALSCGSTT